MKIIGAILLVGVLGTVNAQSIKGTFAIKNVETGKLLRIKDANRKDGTPLVLYSPVNWKCMTWDFRYISENTYQLTNLFTDKTFSPENDVEAGVALKQGIVRADNEQQYWEFLKQADDFYLIRLAGTELFLTPSDPDGAVNSPLVLAKRQKNGLQKWVLYEQHPTF